MKEHLSGFLVLYMAEQYNKTVIFNIEYIQVELMHM